jgi:hypothetical protein
MGVLAEQAGMPGTDLRRRWLSESDKTMVF